MWTTQERCPHAHSLNNKYKSQTTAEDSTPTDSPEEAKNKSKRQFDCFGSTAFKSGASQPRPSARAAATPVPAFGIYPGRHSQTRPENTDSPAQCTTEPRTAAARHSPKP